MKHTTLLVTSLVACVTAAVLLLSGCAQVQVDPPEFARASGLYARHCAACHGPRGAADTALVRHFVPPPRDFALGAFNLVSTANGLPTEDDLFRVLDRGIPGSLMPSFDWLPEDDRRGLARFVRHLAIDGVALRLEAEARAAARPISRTDAWRHAAAALRPGTEISLPDPLEPDADLLARGHALFAVRCAACHGPEGNGFPGETEALAPSGFVWPRKLAAGVLQGGATWRDIGWRIRAGMPASGMPGVRMTDDDTAALVAYTLSLLPAGSQERQVQRRQHLIAHRVSSLPTQADDGRWRDSALVLAPLRRRPDAAGAVAVAFLHDGVDLAMRLRWDDPRPDQDATAGPFPDALALEFADGLDPPLLAMGSPPERVVIWQWQAFAPRAMAGLLDAVAPRLDGTRPDVPMQPLPDATAAPSPAGRAAHGHGIDAAGAIRDARTDLAADARWADGRWTLLLRRRLAAGDHEDVGFRPGARVFVACAVWDGARREVGARKAATDWHRLEFEP